MTEKVLEIRDLHVTFDTPSGPLEAVRGVDLDVSSGELLGVVGESGSGKSVTFLATMGLLPARARVTGSVILAGEQLIGASAKQLRSVRGRLLSMIFQDPLSALNPVHRIGDQISEMLRSHQNLSARDAEKRAIELLDIVGIPQPGDRARQYPHEFSGGMRQRVVIAIAIANNPKVLIADEPTTALDVTVQAQILEVIERVQERFGTAVVLITHDLGVIARVADRVNVMYAGRNVEQGTIDSLFDHPNKPKSTIMNRTELMSPVIGRSQGRAPRTFRTTSRVTKNGNAKNKSVTRIMMSSNLPPRKPATAPTRAPRVTEIMALASPINSETRTP